MISTVRCRLVKLADIFYFRMISVHPLKKPWKQGLQNKKERETGLEPATPTLARSYSTNWATRAYNYYINIINTCKDVYSKLPTKLHFSLGEELVSSLSEKVHLKFACGFDSVSDYIHKFSYLLVKPSTY